MQTRKHLILLAFVLSVASFVHAQDTSMYRYSTDSTIRETLVYGGKYPALIYTANNQVLTRRDIKNRLSLYDASAAELRKFRDCRTGMLLFLAVSLGASVGLAIEKKQNNPGGEWAWGGVFLGAITGEIISGIRSGIHFKRGVREYNRRFAIP